MKNSIPFGGCVVQKRAKAFGLSAVFALLAAGLGATTPAMSQNAPVPKPAKATLGVEDIIHGIEKNDQAWRQLPGWMFRYVHSREQVDPPPGLLVLYGDNQIVNARKGRWLFECEDQSIVANPAHIGARKTWAALTDEGYAERNGNTLTLWPKLTGVMEGNLILNTFYYPNSLFRDFLSDFFEFPKEFWEADEPSLTLPRCLTAHRAEYRVRPELEEVDTFPCHVVERAGKDVFWIDDRCGFSVRRRQVFQPSGSIAAEMKASGFQEKAPGIWVPSRQTGITFNPDSAPQPYRGKVMRVVTNTLIEARIGTLPDELFRIPRPAGMRVIDRRGDAPKPKP